MGVSSGRFNFKDSVFDRKDRNIESTTSKIEDKNVSLRSDLLVKTISNSSSGWFVDNSKNVQTSDGSSIFGGLTLKTIII
jgi:hypothetical protein